jgi:hypothetical protein
MFDDNLYDQLMMNELINDNEQKNHDMSNEMDNQQHWYELFLKHHMHVIVGLHDGVQIFNQIGVYKWKELWGKETYVNAAFSSLGFIQRT